ncbi:hypothetical protein Tco_0268318 [Tanacetum coccineum]
MAQQPMRSEDELCPSDKRVAVNSGALNLGRGRGKGYMRKGGLEVNASKKKKAEVPRRSRTITVADNLLEDPCQDVDFAKSINLEENHQREKERRSKARHAALVLEE